MAARAPGRPAGRSAPPPAPGEAASRPLGGPGTALADKSRAVCGGRDFLPPRLVLALLEGQEGSDALTLHAKAVRGERDTHPLTHTPTLTHTHISGGYFSFLFRFVQFRLMISAAVRGCYLETPRAGAPRLPACLPIKGRLAPCDGPVAAAEDRCLDRPRVGPQRP